MADRVSREQRLYLIDYMENHVQLSRGLGQGVQARGNRDKMWQFLEVKLNSIKGGSSKTACKWKRYWTELKSRVKLRASSLKREHGGTGGGPSTQVPMDDVEERVLGLISVEAVEGDKNFRVPAFASNQPSTSPDLSNNGEKVLDENTGFFMNTRSLVAPSPSGNTQSPMASPRRTASGLRRRQLFCTEPSTSTKKKTKLDWVYDLEARRIAAEEKMAEAALITAKASLLQAENQKELIELLKNKNNI